MTTTTITAPDPVALGAFAAEVATNRAARGDWHALLADALILLSQQAAADVTALAALADAGIGVVHRTVTVAFGDFAALGAGVKTKDYNIGASLPANATLFAVVKATDFTGFDDNGSSGTAALVVGTSAGGNEIGTSLNVATGQTGFPKQFATGVNGFPTASLTTAQAQIRFTSNHDLNTFTAGSVKVHLYYFVLA